MKKSFILLVLAAFLGSLALSPAAVAFGTQTPGTVTINYDLNRIPAIASNQVAVWVEDSQGNFVKTIFVTWYTGKGGYEKRPDCLPLWRKAAGVDGPPSAEVDAVTRATQQPGRHSLVWDCTDRAGKAVAAGKYVYKIEGTLFWTKEALWSGEITVGSQPASSRAALRYLPDDSPGGEQLVYNVTAAFTPAESGSR